VLSEWISSVWLRMRALAKRRQLDRDLQDEIAFHLAMREEKLRSNERGNVHREDGSMGEKRDSAAPGDELYSARRAFGNAALLKEDTRLLWTFRWLEHVGQDLRYAGRSMRKTPLMAAVVVLSLALGIGANTAIFTLMDAVMLRMLPVSHPEELFLVERGNADGTGNNSFTNPLWEAVRDHQDMFSAVFAWSTAQFDLAQGGEMQRADGLYVSGGYFPGLGVRPAAGRLIAATDDQRGCAPVAVLSYGFWQEHFGGAAEAVGRTISLNRQVFQIIGVAAPGFTGTEVGEKFDAAIPICSSAVFDGKESRLTQLSWWWLRVAGRKKPGLSREQIESRLAVLSPAIMNASLPPDWPEKEKQHFLNAKLVAVPGSSGLSQLRENFAGPLTILMAIVGAVLLIACANIASLMLARSSSRSKELAIRKAVGASRGRLVRQLVTESLLLSSLGAALGLLFARWGSGLLVRRISVGHTRVFLDLSPDVRVLAFTAALTVATGILVGVLPALRSTRVSLMAAMKAGQSSESDHRTRFRAGKWIVASQVAMSLVLVVSGGLLLRSFQKLLTLDPGFDRRNVLLVQASVNRTKFSAEQRMPIYDEIERRLAAIPGVTAVARSFTTPLKGWEWNNFLHAEGPNAPTGEQALTYFNAVTPGYFQVMRMQLLEGRELNERDTGNSPSVAVVTKSLARKFFSNTDPVGKRFRIEARPGKTAPLVEIVGVVNDAKYESLREETIPTAFFPASQALDKVPADGFELRTSVPPTSIQTAVEQAVAGVNKEVSLEFRTLEQQFDDDVVQERLLATLSGFFGGLALLLAMIGLYGVLSYLVTQRQMEFGVRMALGARPASILRLVMADTFIVLASGVTAGLLLSLATVRLLQKMLFGLSPHDALTTATATGVLAVVGLLAGYLPARRATRVDPMVALRYE
jgi:putative ABC transport system permease protein